MCNHISGVGYVYMNRAKEEMRAREEIESKRRGVEVEYHKRK